jgi:hypothetical protein
LLYAAASAAILLATACGDDEGPGKLFEEEGSWSLTQYNLDGGGLNSIDNDVRGDAFMLRFNASEKVVQTAMCGETEQDTPGNSQCKLIPQDTSWFCHCYAYAYEDDVMVWREFDAGSTPPEVTIDDASPGGSSASASASGTGGDTDTDGGGDDSAGAPSGDAIRIELAALPNISSTYQFRPLPVGIWGSDGSISSYVLQQKAASVFDQALEDPEGRTSCQPCI